MSSLKKWLRNVWFSFWEYFFGKLISNIEDNDPLEDMWMEKNGWKPWFFLLIVCPMFYHPETRLYMFLWLLSGCMVVYLRLFITAFKEKVMIRQIVGRELICAWRSGDLTTELYLFWPFDLLGILILGIFKKCRDSFSNEYREMVLSAYNSGRGKYHGMHFDTALEWSQNNVVHAAEDAVEIVESTKRQSRFALVYGSIVSFIIAPFNYLRGVESGADNQTEIELISQNSGNTIPYDSDNSNDFFTAVIPTIVTMIKRFFEVILFLFSVIFYPAIIRHWFLPPVRYIPMIANVLVESNPVNAPPVAVFVYNFFNKNQQKLFGGIKWKRLNFI